MIYYKRWDVLGEINNLLINYRLFSGAFGLADQQRDNAIDRQAQWLINLSVYSHLIPHEIIIYVDSTRNEGNSCIIIAKKENKSHQMTCSSWITC